jgi:hypothetical protein
LEKTRYTQAVAKKRKCPYADHAAGTPILEAAQPRRQRPKVVVSDRAPRGSDILADGLRRDRDNIDSIHEEAMASLGLGRGKYPL